MDSSFTDADLKHHHPFRHIVSGASFSGKSTFLGQFLRNLDHMVDTNIDKIIYLYSIDQPLYQELRKDLPNIIWIQGYPDDLVEKYLYNPNERKLLICDDLMSSLANNKQFAEFITTHSHHLNTSCIITLQNLLYKGKEMRTVHLNSTGYVLFKNPRDILQSKILFNQLGTLSAKNVMSAYKEATKPKFSYLFLDLHMETPDFLRVRTGVLPGQKLLIFAQ